MVTIKQNWPWKKCFRRTFSNYDMNARNRVQLLIKFQYHWHNSFMCFLQYLLFTSISGCCNKSFTMNMCPPEQKSLQRVSLFVCLFVCLLTLCSQVECRPPMLSFNVHLMPKKASEGYLVHNALSHCSIIMWKVAMVVPGNNIFVHKNLKYLYVFFTYPNVGLLQHFFNYHPRPDNKL